MKNQIIVTVSIVFLLLSITLVTSCTAQSGNKEQKVVKTEAKVATPQMVATQKPQQSSEATKTIDENLQKIEHALNSGVYDNNPEMKKKLQEMANRLEADRKKTNNNIPKTNAAKKAKEGETVIYSTQDEKTGEKVTLEMTKEEYKKYRGDADKETPFDMKKEALKKIK